MNIMVGLFLLCVNIVLTSLNWFDLGKIMMFVYIWCKQTAFSPKMSIYSSLFLPFYICRWFADCQRQWEVSLPVAGGNGNYRQNAMSN